MGPTSSDGISGSGETGSTYAPGAGVNMSQQAGATTETLGMTLAFVTEFNANTQIFLVTTTIMLGIISQQDANIRQLEGWTNHLEGRTRNLESRINQMGRTPAGADSNALRHLGIHHTNRDGREQWLHARSKQRAGGQHHSISRLPTPTTFNTTGVMLVAGSSLPTGYATFSSPPASCRSTQRAITG